MPAPQQAGGQAGHLLAKTETSQALGGWFVVRVTAILCRPTAHYLRRRRISASPPRASSDRVAGSGTWLGVPPTIVADGSIWALK